MAQWPLLFAAIYRLGPWLSRTVVQDDGGTDLPGCQSILDAAAVGRPLVCLLYISQPPWPLNAGSVFDCATMATG